VRSIFDQPDAATTHAQHTRVADQLAGQFADAARLLEQAESDILRPTANGTGACNDPADLGSRFRSAAAEETC
jgi:hypothetical protein